MWAARLIQEVQNLNVFIWLQMTHSMLWHIWQVQILSQFCVLGLDLHNHPSTILSASPVDEPPHEDSCLPSSQSYVAMSQLDQASDSVRIVGWGPVHRCQGTEKGRLSHRSTQPSQPPGLFCQFLCSLLGLALQLTSLRKEVTSYILVHHILGPIALDRESLCKLCGRVTRLEACWLVNDIARIYISPLGNSWS